jgi:uracil-DNA glycosylase
MPNIMNIEEYKQKIFNKLEPSGWGKVLKSFIFSSDFDKILMTLYESSNNGIRFTPTVKDLFRTFEECPFDELKVVIVGQDPYPQLGVADGIAFSCSKSQREQPSLKYILDEVEKMYPMGYERPLDLSKWTRQGIILLNTALTTEVGKIGKHYDLWKTFIAYLFDYLNHNVPGIVYIYMGNKAKEWADFVDNTDYKFYLTHPASAAYNGSVWNSKNTFTEVTQIIEKNFGTKIIW